MRLLVFLSSFAIQRTRPSSMTSLPESIVVGIESDHLVERQKIKE